MTDHLRKHGTVIRLLSGDAESGGAAVGLSQKEFALLALLVMRGKPIAARTLIENLWPLAPPLDAARVLDAYVERLHKRFKRSDLIVTNDGAYYLAADVRSDLDEIEACIARAPQTPDCAGAAKVMAGRLSDGPPLFMYDYPLGRDIRPRLDDIIEALEQLGPTLLEPA